VSSLPQFRTHLDATDDLQVPAINQDELDLVPMAHLGVPHLHVAPAIPFVSAKARITPRREGEFERLERVVYDNVPFHVGFDLVDVVHNDPASRQKYVCSGVMLKLEEQLVDVAHVLSDGILNAVESLALEKITDDNHAAIIGRLDL